MKIIILVGPGEVGKRNAALKLRKQFDADSITTLDLKTNSEADLDLSLSSSSLFSTGPRLVVVENTPDRLDLEKFIKTGTNLTLLLLSGNPRVDSKILTSAKKIKAQIISFEGEKELTAFPYLDNLIEGKKEAFVELNKLLSEYGGMYVLAMVYYLLRRNILPLPKFPFMQKKIKSQKQKYNLEDWKKLYKLVLASEFDIKSGNLTEDLGLVLVTQKFIEQSF